MKNLLCGLLIMMLMGCANIAVPNYIQDKHPYQRTFYAPFDAVYKTTIDVLDGSGWAIEKESAPILFERQQSGAQDSKQTLLFTETHESYFFVGSKHGRINIYLRETATNETEVELRYVKVSSLIFKSFYGYRNDRMVERIFQDIEAGLNVLP